MKHLGSRVNIIPVIGRADGLLPNERLDFKRRVMEDIAHHQIPVFTFPTDEEDDEETVQECNTLKVDPFRFRLDLTMRLTVDLGADALCGDWRRGTIQCQWSRSAGAAVPMGHYRS